MGQEERFAVPRGDDAIVALFPALAAHVAEEALLRDLDRLGMCRFVLVRRADGRAHALA
jgi:hypothetical protein